MKQRKHHKSNDAFQGDSSTTSVARARWRLLRASPESKSDGATASIRRFPGFQLLSQRANIDENEMLLEKLI
jgi:hypothetical protein